MHEQGLRLRLGRLGLSFARCYLTQPTEAPGSLGALVPRYAVEKPPRGRHGIFALAPFGSPPLTVGGTVTLDRPGRIVSVPSAGRGRIWSATKMDETRARTCRITMHARQRHQHANAGHSHVGHKCRRSAPRHRPTLSTSSGARPEQCWALGK